MVVKYTERKKERKFGGKSFSYYGGSYAKEPAMRIKDKLMNGGAFVRIVKGRESITQPIEKWLTFIAFI